MGEPSSGGLTLLQILGMVERFDLRGWGPEDSKSWHAIAESSRLAFADRGKYMADPDFVNTPGVALINPDYLKARSALIEAGQVLEQVEAGAPPGWEGSLFETGGDISKPGTSHISVVDKDGNIVSMTTTIEGAFGSHVMVGGFLLNNELTDFSFRPLSDDGAQIANMVEAGKRPRSSMAPTIVFDQDGKPVLVIGSAGGSNIIGYVLQRIIAMIDWGMELDEALSMPNILSRGAAVEIERDMPDLSRPLTAMGHRVEIKDKNSGLSAIHITDKGLKGATDPRREGIGMGR
jgi:gamma-glutamyltranspeptidase/glutathione hydrolase